MWRFINGNEKHEEPAVVSNSVARNKLPKPEFAGSGGVETTRLREEWKSDIQRAIEGIMKRLDSRITKTIQDFNVETSKIAKKNEKDVGMVTSIMVGIVVVFALATLGWIIADIGDQGRITKSYDLYNSYIFENSKLNNEINAYNFGVSNRFNQIELDLKNLNYELSQKIDSLSNELTILQEMSKR